MAFLVPYIPDAVARQSLMVPATPCTPSTRGPRAVRVLASLERWHGRCCRSQHQVRLHHLQAHPTSVVFPLQDGVVGVGVPQAQGDDRSVLSRRSADGVIDALLCDFNRFAQVSKGHTGHPWQLFSTACISSPAGNAGVVAARMRPRQPLRFHGSLICYLQHGLNAVCVSLSQQRAQRQISAAWPGMLLLHACT